ncbi:histidine phosphatase family protein [Paraglaciecola aestuariivivens]
MSEFYLVRHGQASFGAENYDNLSPLGHQQAKWLGEYFASRNVQFSDLYLGDLQRHTQTAEGIVAGLGYQPKMHVNTGFNEFDFENIGAAFLQEHPQHQLPKQAPAADFYRLLKLAMRAWAHNEIASDMLQESWADFQTRVQDALAEVCKQPSKQAVLIVSSGGAMSMLMSLVLGLDAQQVIELNMQIKNTSVSQFYFNQHSVRLASFNNVPHLDCPERLDSITFS